MEELSKAGQASLGARGHLPRRMPTVHKNVFLKDLQLLFGVLSNPGKFVLTNPGGPGAGTTPVSIPAALDVTGTGWQQVLPDFRAAILRSDGWEGQKLFAGRICFSISCLYICGKASLGHGQLRKCISLHSAACEVQQCPARDLLPKITFVFNCLESPTD